MRTALRLFLAATLVVSLGVRMHTLEAREGFLEDFDISARTAAFLRAHGRTIEPNPARPDSVLSVIVHFRQRGCDAPMIAMPFSFNVDARTMLNRVGRPGDVHRIYYLDSAWDSQDRIGMYLTWVRHSALAVVGSTAFLPVKQALAVSGPPDCVAAADLGWNAIWAAHPRSGTE